MKNFKFLSVAFVAMAMFVCNTAYAQYYSRPAGSTSSKSYSYTYDEARDRNIVELEFALGHFGNIVQSCGLQSLTYSFIHAFGLSSSKPWFAELGAGMEYSWTDGKLGCLHNLAFVIPVRVSYEIETAGSLRIVPFGGLFLRLNQTGDLDDDYINGSIYKDSDITDQYGKFNRFQVGFQLGGRVRFTKNFHTSLAFKHDLSKWCGRIDGKTWNIGLSLGLDF